MLPWLFPLVTTTLLGVLVGLVAWIGKGFDRRLGNFDKRISDFERMFDDRMSKLELILDRGERHEASIAKLQNEVSDLRVDLARWGGN